MRQNQHTNGNGTANLDIPALKERLRRARLEAKLASAEHSRKVLESLSWDASGWTYGGSDLWDAVRPRQNDGGDRGWIPLSYPTDRRHGEDWPVWRTIQELDLLRQQSRVRVATNSFAKGLLRNLTNNVIGKGCTYKVQVLDEDGKPAAEDKLTPEGLSTVKAVQKVVDEFLRDNHWNGGVSPQDQTALGGTREREIFRTVLIDGECFIRFHAQQGGKMLVRLLDAAQIRDTGHTPAQGWSFGVQHQMEPFEDVETPLSYSVYWPDAAAKGGEGGSEADQGMWEEIDADEILHLKGPDTASTVKRGLGIFLFDIGEALDRASRLSRNASMGAAVRAAIASTEQWETATQTQLQSMADALADYQVTDQITGHTQNVERVFPGMIRRVPKGWEQAPAADDNTESYLSGVQSDLQHACAGAGVASFVLGDIASGNYSNFETGSFPPILNAMCEQEYYKAAFARAVWKAVEWAVECGKLPRLVLEEVTITVEAPAVLHRNELEKAQEDQILIENGIKDRQTACAERGLDWKSVEANNDEYTKKQQAMMPQPVPGQPGQGKPPPGGAGPPKPPKPPAPKPPRPVGESLQEAEHDVSGEKRDDSGRWTAGGGAGGSGDKAGREQARRQQHQARADKLRKQDAAAKAKQAATQAVDAFTQHAASGEHLVDELARLNWSGEAIEAASTALDAAVAQKRDIRGRGSRYDLHPKTLSDRKEEFEALATSASKAREQWSSRTPDDPADVPHQGVVVRTLRKIELFARHGLEQLGHVATAKRYARELIDAAKGEQEP